MKFRTEYIANKAPFVLDPQKPVVLIGSCFSQNIAAKMESHLWKAVNPSGTLYNPYSICLAMDMMTDLKNGLHRFENTLFYYNGIWNSHQFDSSFSSNNREDCIENFKIKQNSFCENLKTGKQLIITFGTSIYYYLTEEKTPVGNCHKQPSSLFYTKRLTSGECVSIWNKLYAKLGTLFPGVKIIFTVSPVRHLKNGFEGNARSKAVLLLATEEICEINSDCFYFPAFEILNDDLRDYRFYASDLVHPSDEAIEYMWDKFKETFIDNQGVRILEEGSKEFKAANHRPKTGALGKPLYPQ